MSSDGINQIAKATAIYFIYSLIYSNNLQKNKIFICLNDRFITFVVIKTNKIINLKKTDYEKTNTGSFNHIIYV